MKTLMAAILVWFVVSFIAGPLIARLMHMTDGEGESHAGGKR